MTRRRPGAWGWVAGAVAISALAGGCSTARDETQAAIAWNTSMEVALADAGANGRPILLNFYTDW